MMRKSKFVSLSQLASKATGGAYGGHAPTLPPSSSAGPSPSTPTHSAGPHTPGGGSRDRDATMEKKRMTWADRVREKLPPLDANEYEVLWERGVLGVIFLESEKDGIPYVSKATESCISPLVQPGDILKFVNDVRSEKHSFSEFFKILATMKKPVLLRFERPASGAPSSLPRTPSPEGLAREPPAPAIGEQRSISTNDIGGSGAASRATAMKDAAKALAAKVQRSNSLPQSDKQQATTPSPMQQKPVARGTFWRASTAKELATPQQQHLQATPKMLGGMPATPKTPKRRDMQSPVAKQKYDGDTDTSDSPNEPWDEDDRANDDEYQHIEVYWETGSLGLFFGEERGTGYPVVTRSTPGVNPSVHRKVQVNDVLLAANGVRSADFSFEAFFARLQQMSKPVKLVFKRKVVGPGTPPPQARKTSFPTEPSQSAPPPVPARTPSPVPQPKASTVESIPVTPTPSRPTRLPLPSPTNETSVPDMRHTTANAVTQQSNGFLRQDPSPSSKPRSTSVETRSLMEDEHSPVSGDSNTLRGKSPSRPDIVFLGSPQKKPRGPPPSPPANLALDLAPSPREKIEKKPPTPSSQTTSSYAPSPREKRPSPSPGPEKSRPDVLVLGDDFGVSPREKFKAVELTEDEIVEEEEEAAADGLVIEEGVAVGVPLDSSVVAEEGLHVESAEVADAVLAVAVEDVERVSSKASTSSSVVSSDKLSVEVGLPVSEPSSEGLSGVDDETDREDSDDSSSQSGTESESDEGEPLDAMVQDDPDISGDLDSNEILTNDPKSRGSISSPSKPNKAAMNASLAKYKKKSKNSRPMVKLPAINEDASQTVPLAAPNAVNTNVQVRGRTKPKPSLVETPDSSTYLVKWKEGRSVGLQLREVRMAKGTFPLVVDVCKDPCCDVLKHVCIGDVIVEINGRNCSTMGVKKTVNFLKTSSKTMLLKLRRGPAFLNERVSAYA